MENREKQQFCELPVREFCEAVSRPEVPSPTGGAVIGLVAAMIAGLTELVIRVSKTRIAGWQEISEEAQRLRHDLLRFADEDVQEAAKLIRGEEPACVRKQISAPAKIASGLVKVLQLTEQAADRIKPSVRADLRAIAHLGRGAAAAIFDIEQENIKRDGGDAVLQARIEEWRSLAVGAANRILDKARD